MHFNDSNNSLLSRLSARTGLPTSQNSSSSLDPTSPITLLGTPYPSPTDQSFISHYSTIPWITYRNNYVCIGHTQFKSDVGWGCMLRTGQMMLGYAFLVGELGRGWRINERGDGWEKYVEIISRFLDTPTAPFSIHNIALAGTRYGKNVGEWFGPTTISFVLQTLVDKVPQIPLTIHIATDGVMYIDSVKQHWDKSRDRGILILFPLMLGVEVLNPFYFDALKACFTFPHCVGIAGGRPNSSLYFLGFQPTSSDLLYLDPHHLRPSIPIKAPSQYSPEDLSTYQTTVVRTMPIEAVDPSMVLGFYCRDWKDFEEFVGRAREVSRGKTPLFTIEDTKPEFVDRDGEVWDDGGDGDDF